MDTVCNQRKLLTLQRLWELEDWSQKINEKSCKMELSYSPVLDDTCMYIFMVLYI